MILSDGQTTAQSDVNGLASLIPSTGAFTGALEIEIQVSAGSSATLQDTMESFPPVSGSILPPVSGGKDEPPVEKGPRRLVQADDR